MIQLPRLLARQRRAHLLRFGTDSSGLRRRFGLPGQHGSLLLGPGIQFPTLVARLLTTYLHAERESPPHRRVYPPVRGAFVCCWLAVPGDAMTNYNQLFFL